MPKITKLKDIDISFVSFVKKGANRKKIIWKSDTGDIEMTVAIAKTDNEKRLVYGVVYSPDEVDTQNEYTTAEEIEKAAHKFLQNLRQENIDVNHTFEKVNAIAVESYIAKKDESDIIPGATAGSWVIAIKVNDDQLWESVKKGEYEAFSMAGYAAKISKQADESFSYNIYANNIKEFLGKMKTTLKSILSETKTDVEKTRELLTEINKKQKELEKQNMEEFSKELREIEKMLKEHISLKRSVEVDKNVKTEKQQNDNIGLIIKSDSENLLEMIEKAEIRPESLSVGGELRPEASSAFINFIAKQDIFKDVTVMRSSKLRKDIDVYAFENRVLGRVPQGDEPTDFIGRENIGKQLEMKEVNLFSRILFETIWDNKKTPNFEQKIAADFMTMFSNDLQLLAFEGIADDYSDGFKTLNEGWYKLAESAGAPSVDTEDFKNVSGTVNYPALLSEMIAMLPAKYKTNYVKIYINQADYEIFLDQIAASNSSLGTYLVTGNIPKFKGYEIKPNMYTQNNKIIITPAPNLVFGVNTSIQRYREVKYSKRAIEYTYVASIDFQIIKNDAIVISK